MKFCQQISHEFRSENGLTILLHFEDMFLEFVSESSSFFQHLIEDLCISVNHQALQLYMWLYWVLLPGCETQIQTLLGITSVLFGCHEKYQRVVQF